MLNNFSITGGMQQVRRPVTASTPPLPQPPSPPMEARMVQTEEDRQTQHIRNAVHEIQMDREHSLTDLKKALA